MNQKEIERIKRVSDMLCSAHANLRDRYTRSAFFLDFSIFAFSTWLVAMVFVEPQVGYTLTPFGTSPKIWLGLLAIFTFLLSILQVLVGWKGKADAHDRSLSMFAEVKRECGYILALDDSKPNERNLDRLLDRYDMANDVAVPIPEREFLKQKKKHLKKVEISRHLDKHPSASLSLFKLSIWWRDNFGSGKE